MAGQPSCPVPAPRRTAPWGLADLRDVIAGQRSAGELVIRYQPVVSATDAEPLAVEALVRWKRPDGSLLPPDAFVGLAEANGLGGELDEVVLGRALAQVPRWDAAGIRVHRVAVNVGRTSVLRHDLVEVVAAACANSGAGPDRLALELLEHDRLDPDAFALGRLQDLADAGALIAVDDFGSGYAGIGLLSQLPLGLVKLDRSLIPNPDRVAARSAPRAEAVFAGAIALAQAVGAEITAEGVETAEQWDLCAGLGVGHLQGWLFAPAVDADAVVDFWRAPPLNSGLTPPQQSASAPAR